jgi:streptomycin 6-kinase
LSLLLDPDAFRAKLRSTLPETDLGEAQATYVRYKPGTSCLVKYEFGRAGGPTTIYAKGFRHDAHSKLEKGRMRVRVPGAWGFGGVVLDDVAVAVYVFPNDQELQALAHLTGEESRLDLFARVLPRRPELWHAALHTLRYKPERRYLARLVTGVGKHALLRIYDQGDYPNAARAAKVFASRGPLRVAQRLGHSNRDRIIIVEWLPGSSLYKAMRHASFDPGALGAVGAALAELHAQNVKGLQVLSREAQADSLLSTAGGVAALCPGLEERIRNLAARLAASLVEVDGEVRPIHGDFSADQVLLTDRGGALIDLDAAAYGDPIADLGSFVAALELEVLMGDLSASTAEAVTGAFVEGYCAARRRRRPSHLNLCVAAAMLRLAPHPFRYREPDWPQRTQAIVGRAELTASRRDKGY